MNQADDVVHDRDQGVRADLEGRSSEACRRGSGSPPRASAQRAPSTIASVAAVGRGVHAGALLGAVLGLIAGLIVHAIASSNSALPRYEFIAALLGLIFGGIVGAFHGGALKLPRGDKPS